MTWLETKIPPPIVALSIAFLMWLSARMLPAAAFRFEGVILLAGIIAVIGVAFDLSGLLAFRRRDTTILPMKPEKAKIIVRDGVFRVTRNPMYLGLALVLLAWGIFLENWVAVFLPLTFVAFITRFQILPEERALRAKFGPEYEDYLASTRRWL